MFQGVRGSISNCEENSVLIILIKAEDTHVSSTYYYYLNFMIVYANRIKYSIMLRFNFMKKLTTLGFSPKVSYHYSREKPSKETCYL